MDVEDFAVAVRNYCVDFHASVTSWGRTAKHNEAVGGKPTSRHLVFLAVDVVYDDPVGLYLAQERAFDLGLRLIREPTHDHLQPL